MKKTKYRVIRGITYTVNPAIERQLRAGENIPFDQRDNVDAKPGDIVDNIPTGSLGWLLERGIIERVIDDE